MDCCWSPTDSALEDDPSGAGMDAHSNKPTELVNNRTILYSHDGI